MLYRIITIEVCSTIITKLSIIRSLMSTFFTVFHEIPPVHFDVIVLNYQVMFIILKLEIRFISRKNQKAKPFSHHKDPDFLWNETISLYNICHFAANHDSSSK